MKHEVAEETWRDCEWQWQSAVLFQICGQTVAEFVNKLQCNLHPGYQPLLK